MSGKIPCNSIWHWFLSRFSFSSISNLVVARGDSTGKFPLSIPSVESKVKSIYNCVSWNPFPVDMWTGSDFILYSWLDLMSLINISFECENFGAIRIWTWQLQIQHLVQQSRDGKVIWSFALILVRLKSLGIRNKLPLDRNKRHLFNHSFDIFPCLSFSILLCCDVCNVQ